MDNDESKDGYLGASPDAAADVLRRRVVEGLPGSETYRAMKIRVNVLEIENERLRGSAEPQTGLCIDCDGSGAYPSGATCKSCGGSGRVGASDGPPADPTRIAHDVALESGMAHESLSALTSVIQEGIDRALATLGEPDGMETTAEERAQWNSYDPQTQPTGWLTPLARAARDIDRLLARETKAREGEREANASLWPCAPNGETNSEWLSGWETAVRAFRHAIRARTAPNAQSEIGLRAHLADLSARGLKP